MRKSLIQSVKRHSIVLLLLLGLQSSGKLAVQSNFAVTNIRNIQYQPEKTTTVYLKGTVIKGVPLLNGQVYQLDDASGKIWVFTTSTLPQVGDEITIAGEIRYQSITVEELDLGEVYVWESKQLQRQAAQGDAISNE